MSLTCMRCLQRHLTHFCLLDFSGPMAWSAVDRMRGCNRGWRCTSAASDDSHIYFNSIVLEKVQAKTWRGTP